jgi:hypothetical protein
MHEHLAQIPATLERVGQIQPIRAPNNMAWGVKGGHLMSIARALTGGTLKTSDSRRGAGQASFNKNDWFAVAGQTARQG